VFGGLAVLIYLLAYYGMGVYFAQLGPTGYVFWFGLPSLIFITVNTWVCRSFCISQAA
jgi:hypothetical protein